MSHAIRIRCATPAAPEDALERIESVRSTYRTTLEMADMPYHTATDPGPEFPVHDVGLYRFDEAEDKSAILDAFSNDAFPSVEWLLIESHICVNEGDPQARGDCDGWTIEEERGNVPDVFL